MSDFASGSVASNQIAGFAFSIVPQQGGLWRVERGDGLVSGLFFHHKAALRFVDLESRRYGRLR
jgi:hypothetical protein